MRSTFVTRTLAAAAVGMFALHGVAAQVQTATAAPSALPLFAVEITVGSKWDRDKPAQEQRFFGDHSSNLKRGRSSNIDGTRIDVVLQRA